MESASDISGHTSQSEDVDNTTNVSSDGMTILDGTFFKPVSEKCTGNNIIAVCIKCQPVHTEIKGFLNSSSNFLCHLKRRHGSQAVDEYQAHVSKKRKFKHSTNYPIGHKLTQEEFEHGLLKFILRTMVPLSIVEEDGFTEFLTLLGIYDAGLKIISRRSLCRQMEHHFTSHMQKLKDIFQSVTFICTTADIWSTRQKSFLGVTAHWIKEDMTRGSAALACRRFKGMHTAERITEMLSDIHGAFELFPPKLTVTVTDNGSNFVKAFREYGVTEDCVIVAEGDEDLDGMEKQSVPLLPNHIKCVAHTLNLCASSDVAKTILESAALSTIHNEVTSKCNLLWRAAARPKSAEVLHRILGCSLSRPGITRWNSFYDALKKIRDLSDKCAQAFHELELSNPLTANEFIYIDEHLTCAQPVAEAIDIIQGDAQTYFGIAMPVLFALRSQLEELCDREWKFCQPIAESLLNSVRRRFNNYYELSTQQALNGALAALSHPLFKNEWMICLTAEKQNSIMRLFTTAVAEEQSFSPTNIEDQTNKPTTSTFFKYRALQETTQNPCSTSSIGTDADFQTLHYLNNKSSALNILDSYPQIKKVFWKYNTPLPSSAPVERMFSYCSILNTSRATNISDETFEARILTKVNSVLNI